MSKISFNIFSEFFNSFLYAVKSNQLNKFFSKVIKEIIFFESRKKLPNKISGLNKLSLKYDLGINNFKYKKNNEPPNIEYFDVKLAGKLYKLAVSNMWEISWTDVEEVYALHRFGWLLNINADFLKDQNYSNFGLFFIINWIECNSKGDNIGWDSYSVSERISNWVLFLNNKAKPNNDQNLFIIKSMNSQLSFLLDNLELRGEATNNHIINNGRALYLGGLYISSDIHISSGRQILLDSIDHMFSKSGFLREGSSHYQVLMARTYLEVLFAARKFNDINFENILTTKVQKIWRATCFFLQEKDIPIFGDVSPDFSTDFHSGVGVIGEALLNLKSTAIKPKKAGWHSFFNLPKNVNNIENLPKGLTSYKDAGYCSYRGKNFSIYIYQNPKGHVASWSHGHSDACHLILYFRGEPFLIGTGRLNYKNNLISKYGRSIRSHNSIQIDSKEPMIIHGLNAYPELMLDGYYSNELKIDPIISNNECIIKLHHNGYKRLFGDLTISRTIKISDYRVSIEDKIKGSRPHFIKSFFHFSPEVKNIKKFNDKYHMTLKSNNIAFTHFTAGSSSNNCHSNEDNFGLCFPQYGEKIQTSTIIFSQNDALPIINKYIFEIKK